MKRGATQSTDPSLTLPANPVETHLAELGTTTQNGYYTLHQRVASIAAGTGWTGFLGDVSMMWVLLVAASHISLLRCEEISHDSHCDGCNT